MRRVAWALVLSAVFWLQSVPTLAQTGSTPVHLGRALEEITKIGEEAGRSSRSTRALLVETGKVTEAAELLSQTGRATRRTATVSSSCIGTADDAAASLCNLSAELEREALRQGKRVASEASAVKLGEDGKLLAPEGTQVVRLSEDGEIWVSGEKISDDAVRELKSIGAAEQDLARESERIARACGGDVTCVADELKKAAKKPWFKRLLESTCLGRNRDALVSTLYGLGVSLTAFGAGYALTPGGEDKEFPFDVLAHTTIITFIYGNMACVNTLERPSAGNSSGELGPYYTRENLKQGYIAYLKYTPIQVGTLVALSAGEEALRGRNPFDEEGLKRIGIDAAFGLAYGAFILGPRSVGWVMPLYYRWLPKWGRAARAAWGTRLGRIVGESGQRTFVFGAAAMAPAALMHVGARVTNDSAERWLFMTLRDHFVPSGASDPESPTSTDPDAP